jgi:ribosomal protein S8E
MNIEGEGREKRRKPGELRQRERKRRELGTWQADHVTISANPSNPI